MGKTIRNTSCFVPSFWAMDATEQQARHWREYPVLWPLVHEMFTEWLKDNAPETYVAVRISMIKPLKKAEVSYESSMAKYWKLFEDDWVDALREQNNKVH